MLLDTLGNQQEVTIWVGEGGMFDVANPKTRQWLANRYKQLTDMGIAGWWGDLGEPEVHPLSGLHANGLTAPLYHNQYGNDWSEIIYDLFKKEYPNTRLMTMMRGGTIGLQRYSVYPWSTDVSRSWGGLEPQVRIMINSGLSGLGYMGHDVGGFAVDKDSEYMPELYVRWLQLGLFSPILRTHAQAYAEPYNYPQYESIIKNIIKQRYTWLPYNYTLAWENAAKGYPLVRPLNFTDNSRTYDNISDEFLWGSQVLVAPVMTEGTTSRTVVFPDGQWIDPNNTAAIFPAHSSTVVDAPIDVLPIFVRAGAFIPSANYNMENTGDYDSSRLTVNYYPVADVDSEFTMFDDDHTSTGTLADDCHRLIKFEGSANGSRIKISAEGSYTGAPDNIHLNFVINRVAAPATFRVNGRTVKPKYDATAHTLTFDIRWPVARILNIESNNLSLCSQE
jgi:alpha-glucosidase (family GH31 glycosyl hydrolase)